jgi:hypothetical protein
MVMRTSEKFVTEALHAVPARKKRAVAFRFTVFVRPNLDIAGAAPTLAAFSKECEAMDAFKSVAIG